jgi:hypothetical protein
MSIPSVVVHDFDVNKTDGRPYEADAPLVVDTNTVLTLSITFQGLEARDPIAGVTRATRSLAMQLLCLWTLEGADRRS